MGGRKITVKQSAADSIAEIAWFIESKGMIKTAEKFSDQVYDFIGKLSPTSNLILYARTPSGLNLDINAYPIRKNLRLYLLKQFLK